MSAWEGSEFQLQMEEERDRVKREIERLVKQGHSRAAAELAAKRRVPVMRPKQAGFVILPPLPVDVAALARRFWSKVDKSGDCWTWTASLDRKGYGQIAIVSNGSKRPHRAHRVAWELTNGEIPHGMCACHRCDNRRCVRPDHLFLGTVGDNNRDMWRKGRGNPNGFTPSSRALALERLPRGDNHYSRKNPERVLRGERNGNAILTPDIVRALRQRRASGESLRVLAAEYGVSEPTVSAIATRRLWRHVS